MKSRKQSIHALPRIAIEGGALPSRAHAIISITTPGYSRARIPRSEWTDGVMYLAFDDVDPDSRPAERSESYQRRWLARYGRPYEVFSPSMAREIRAFVQAHPIGEILVHCDAGLSRSPAIAAALDRCLHGQDAWWWREYPCLNATVYRVMLSELGHAYRPRPAPVFAEC